MTETTENKVKETLGKHILADGFDFVMDYEQSQGSYIVDKLTGKNTSICSLCLRQHLWATIILIFWKEHHGWVKWRLQTNAQ
jgi:hypothetical protein